MLIVNSKREENFWLLFLYCNFCSVEHVVGAQTIFITKIHKCQQI